MKKLLYSLLMLLATVSFISCSDDEGGNGPAATTSPEKEVVGTYSGAWTRTLDGVVDAEGTGTVTVTAGKEYIANFAVTACEDVALTEMASDANVTWQSNGGYRITNYGGANNGFGTSFSGKVNNGQLSLNFKKSVKVGRKQYEYIFKFEGNK